MLKPALALLLLGVSILHTPRRTWPRQVCMTMATATTTKGTGTGFTSEATSACAFDSATSRLTCTNDYKSSQGTAATSTTVTASTRSRGAIDETAVIPPRRRALRVDTTATSARGSSTSHIVYTYDRENRLLQEATSAGAVTTYSAWDAAGRPTSGESVSQAGTNALILTYDDAARADLSTVTGSTNKVGCLETFDADGNRATFACSGPGGVTSRSMTSVTATRGYCNAP